MNSKFSLLRLIHLIRTFGEAIDKAHRWDNSNVVETAAAAVIVLQESRCRQWTAFRRWRA